MDVIYVSTQDELLEACVQWGEPVIAIDIECENNLHYYGSFISIIQISTSTKNWIIDVLLLDDITPVLDMLRDKTRVKIFHDVEFDFRILGYEFQVRPSNVFDTKYVAQLLGKEHLGLGALLEEYFGVHKEKQFQMADWTKRPLSKGMISYAAKDTKYLIELYKQLISELEAKGRLAWAQEEFDNNEIRDFPYKVPEFNDAKGIYILNSEQKGIFKELFILREQLAKKLNKPVHYIMSNKTLLLLAQNPPKNDSAWNSLKGVHKIVKSRSIVFSQAVIKGRKNPVVMEKPPRLKMNSEQKKLLDSYSQARDKAADSLGLERHMIISKDQLVQLVTGDDPRLFSWQKYMLEKFS